MSRVRSKARRWQIVAVAGVAVTMVGVGLGVASAGENSAAPTVNCPGVAGTLPAVPAQAQAEVERNLALLNNQISEANNRLANSIGQGGANFIQNAILGPLADKRLSTINRIETAIGRRAAKPDLNAEGLSVCKLNNGGGASAVEKTNVVVAKAASGSSAGTVNCPSVNNLPAVPAQAKDEVDRNLALLDKQIAEANKRLIDTVGQGGKNFIQNAILGPLAGKRLSTINRIETAIGRNAAKPDLNAEGLSVCTLNTGGGSAPAAGSNAPAANTPEAPAAPAAPAAGVPTVNCPSVNNLPAVPAQAKDEVDRNLALLDKQIAEANNRLATSVGQGGKNFIQNAILGPLAGKRLSTINRIETAIGRNADKPDLNAEGLSVCSLNS